MNKHVIAYALVFLAAIASQPASAADRVSNWSGFYVGGNAGYAWGSESNSLNIGDGPSVLNCHFCSAIVGGNDAALAQNAGSSSFDPRGFVGGAQFGYNWQKANWVYGIEADIGGFSQSQTENSSANLLANTAFPQCFAGGGAAVACTGNFSSTVKADWLITIRPRIGYAWDQSLVYVTGGLAISKLSFSQSYSDNINFAAGNVGGSQNSSASQLKAGWVIGAGLERAMGKNWSLKAEYLYVRFDGLNANGALSDAVTGDFANFSNRVDHFASNIVRVGFNYKFSAAATKY